MKSEGVLEVMIEELRAKLYHISQQENQEDLLRISQLLDEALNEFENLKKTKL